MSFQCLYPYYEGGYRGGNQYQGIRCDHNFFFWQKYQMWGSLSCLLNYVLSQSLVLIII